jgi:hypothetical protein
MSASVDFYCGMLGFDVENRNDKWGWAMLRFDECRLMVDQSINAHPGKFRDAILYLYRVSQASSRERPGCAGTGGHLLWPNGISDKRSGWK